MKKKKMKTLSTFLVMLYICFSTVAFATNYIPPVGEPTAPSGEFNTFASNIIGVMMWAGYAIAVGMIIFIGIKYLIASADEKASMKGALVKVIMGSLIIAGTVTIANVVKFMFT